MASVVADLVVIFRSGLEPLGCSILRDEDATEGTIVVILVVLVILA